MAEHPGKILIREFLEPLGLTQYRLAKHIGCTLPRINQVCLGKRGVTPELAFRLGKYFGNGGMYWMNLQNEWALWDWERKNADK